MANSVYPDQTAPIGAVCSGSTLFSSILNSFISNIGLLFAADDVSRRRLQMHQLYLALLRLLLLQNYIG